jgi:hypothetical protein
MFGLGAARLPSVRPGAAHPLLGLVQRCLVHSRCSGSAGPGAARPVSGGLAQFAVFYQITLTSYLSNHTIRLDIFCFKSHKHHCFNIRRLEVLCAVLSLHCR